VQGGPHHADELVGLGAAQHRGDET
jgi:hypothetical protein